MDSEILWLSTKLLAGRWESGNLFIPEGFRQVSSMDDQPESILKRLLQEFEKGARALIVADVGRFQDDRLWAFVADGINKTGYNPLRGLSALLDKPFLDTTRLFTVPAGYQGVTAVSLGARYPEITADEVVCSHLLWYALLGHAAKLNVVGVLVAESRVNEFDPSILAGRI